MKKYLRLYFLIAMVLVIFNTSTYAQSTTIKTPTNVSVEAIIRSEYTFGQLALIESNAADWIDNHGSNAQRVAPATAKYNCHAYAWHVKDGGNKVWLNAHNDHDDDPEILKKYWSGTNPTYSQANSTNATVCFYGSCWENHDNEWRNNCDHSAEVISSNLFESKWGAWPRYRHSPTDCPYESSNLKYYNVPVNGNDLICTSKNYSTLSISSATYNWNGNKVSFSGSGASVTASKTQNGSDKIYCKIVSTYSGTTISTEKKSVWVGGILPLNLGLFDRQTGMRKFQFCSGQANEVKAVTVDGDASVNEWEWDIQGGHISSSNSNKSEVTIYPTSTPFSIRLRARNSCGWSDWVDMGVSSTSCGGYYSLMVSPNPSDGETTITLQSNTSGEAKLASEEVEWDMEVYTHMKALKAKQHKIRGNSIKVNTQNWKEGVYLVRAKHKGKIITGKLVVKK